MYLVLGVEDVPGRGGGVVPGLGGVPGLGVVPGSGGGLGVPPPCEQNHRRL